ncbi:MAG: Hpt domain-containing protein [Undibacterium sp.]|nr:Hpt domain-containing protein [Undibacterium sp.]
MFEALRVNYLRELPSHIDEVEQLLLALERGSFDLEICRDIYGRVHSLKGSGGTYGLHLLSDVCHPFEDLITSLLENPISFKDRFSKASFIFVDLLRTVYKAYVNGQEPGEEVKEVLKSLRQQIAPTEKSAMIVESSELVVSILRDILKAKHFRVEVVNDGYLALGRLLSEPFDLLITGLETKRLNGIALISAMQKSGSKSSKTKSILLTATTLKIGQEIPDYVVKKDANLKEIFKCILQEVW